MKTRVGTPISKVTDSEGKRRDKCWILMNKYAILCSDASVNLVSVRHRLSSALKKLIEFVIFREMKQRCLACCFARLTMLDNADDRRSLSEARLTETISCAWFRALVRLNGRKTH